jgi:hypothetical protein
MKFNTKFATPVKGSPNSFENKNAYIPTRAFESNDPKEGRTILFETVVVSTPVLASARLNQPDGDGSKKRLLTKDEVDELNGLLNSLHIHDTIAPKSSLVTADSGTQTPIEKKQDMITQSEKVAPNLGRCSSNVFDKKSKAFVEVKRSARLAVPQR